MASRQATLSEARIRAREAFLNRRGVATARTDEKGTHLVAMRDLSVGDIVLDSPPVCCVLSKEDRCEQCFEKESKVSNQFCSGCKTARYCSKECQAEAWSRHHKYECCISAPLHKALDQVPSHVRQELRLLVRMGLLAMRESPDDDEATTSTVAAGGDYKQTFADVLNMPTNANHFQKVDPNRCAGNRELARMAHKLLTSPTLAKKKGLKRACPSQELLSSLLERFACNDFSIWDELLISEGSGCYPLGAILNHSCEPNCVLSFSLSTEHRQVIRVIKDVRAGEELCHAYTDIAKPTPERREHLSVCYGFTCDCSRCTTSHELDKKLSGVAIPKGSALDGVHNRWMEVLESGESEEQITRACEELEAIYKTCSLSHDVANITLIALRSSIFQGYLEVGQAEGAIRMCSLQVQAYETIYPEMHPLLGLQLYTLGNLQIEAGDGAKNEGLVNLKRALAILKVSHGSDKSPMVEGLVSLIKHYTKDSRLVDHK